MDIIISSWALDSYLELKHAGVFDIEDYEKILRPDILELKKYPQSPRFQNNKFWSPATDHTGFIQGGFKMKWHNFGFRRVQLRLPVAMSASAVLCQAYVKTDPKFEMRQLAKFKVQLELIRRRQFTEYGRLS